MIVGLGNPGTKYEKTRHNVGFWVVDRLATGRWEEKKRYRALMSGPYFFHQLEGKTQGRYLLVKPTTFMNRSGEAVAKLMREFKVKPEDVWVVHDEADLPLGRVKIQESGKRSTHNGLESVVEALKGESFVRFRVGIDRPAPGEAWEDYVLKPFSPEQKELLPRALARASGAVKLALEEGRVTAMNEYNQAWEIMKT